MKGNGGGGGGGGGIKRKVKKGKKSIQGWNPTSCAIHSYFLLLYRVHVVHSFANPFRIF